MHLSTVAEAQDQTSSIRKVFDEYDGDGNGEISLVEMTNMIVEMDLHHLGVTKDEIANYVSDEFERVDKDGSGDIDFEEFRAYYQSLQGFLKDKLSVESKHTHVSNAKRPLNRRVPSHHALSSCPLIKRPCPCATPPSFGRCTLSSVRSTWRRARRSSSWVMWRTPPPAPPLLRRPRAPRTRRARRRAERRAER